MPETLQNPASYCLSKRGYNNVFIYSCSQPEASPVLMKLKAKFLKHHDGYLNEQAQNYFRTFPSKSKSFNCFHFSFNAPNSM